MVSTTVLLQALSSTVLISLMPNLILLLFPQFASGEGGAKRNGFLSLGQALAAGGLLGDVFLHTLPHAADDNNNTAGFWILVGFTIFLLVEMLMRSIGVEGGGHHHHHNHNHQSNATVANGTSSSTTTTTTTTTKNFSLLSSTILLNLTADALHNFTDGLAIGASYSIQGTNHNISSNDNDATDGGYYYYLSLITSRAGLATISILFHEIPHELGDFCTLVKAGCSKQQAILAQFFTAIAAMIGTVCGVYAIEGFGGEKLLFITAGGFVYLAAVSILPEVLEDGDEDVVVSSSGKTTSRSSGERLKFRLAQICAFGTGIAFMYAVAMLEEHDHDHDHGHHHHHHHHNHAVNHDNNHQDHHHHHAVNHENDHQDHNHHHHPEL